MVQQRHQSDPIPRACLIRIPVQNFLKGSLRRARILLRDTAFPFRQRCDDFGVIRHRRGWNLLSPRDRFGGGILAGLRWLGRRKMDACDPLGLHTQIDRSHQVRKKELHGRFGIFVLRERTEKSSRQHITVFVIPAQRRFFFAWRRSLQFQLHGPHQAFRKVRRVIVLQFRRETRRKGRFLKERPLDRDHVRIHERQPV